MLSSTEIHPVIAEGDLDRLFKALGDRTRRALLSQLAAGPARVTALARHFDMSLPAVGKHIRVLERAGLVQRTVTGRVHECALQVDRLEAAEQWLAHYRQFWNETLDSLVAHLEDEASPHASAVAGDPKG